MNTYFYNAKADTRWPNAILYNHEIGTKKTNKKDK